MTISVEIEYDSHKLMSLSITLVTNTVFGYIAPPHLVNNDKREPIWESCDYVISRYRVQGQIY